MPRRLLRSLAAGPLAGGIPFSTKVINIFGNAIIGYWPLDDPVASSSARELIARYSNSASTVTFGAAGVGGGAGTAASFNGTSSFINLYSAALAAAFNNQEGSLIFSFRVSEAGVWSDGTNRYPIRFAADNNNSVEINKGSGANTFRMFYIAGGTSKLVTVTTSSTAYLRFGLSWSKSADQLKGYLGGVQQGATVTGLGVWSGALSNTRTLFGGFITTPTNVHNGFLAHVVLLNRPFTAQEISADAALLSNP